MEPKIQNLILKLMDEKFGENGNYIEDKYLLEHLLYFLHESNIGVLEKEFKLLEQEQKKSILKNIFKLMPISEPILKRLSLNCFEQSDLMEIIDNVWYVQNGIVEELKNQKLYIRKQDGESFKIKVEQELEKVAKECDNKKKELSEYNKKKQQLEKERVEKEKIEKEIERIKNELGIQDIEGAKKKHDEYQSILKEIEDTKNRISESQLNYKNFPKDDEE